MNDTDRVGRLVGLACCAVSAGFVLAICGWVAIGVMS